MGEAAQDLIDGTCLPSGEWNPDIIIENERNDTEIWERIRLQKQAKNRERYKRAKDLLRMHGFIYSEHDNLHIYVSGYDLWPSSGKYMNRKTRIIGQGVMNLIKILQTN